MALFSLLSTWRARNIKVFEGDMESLPSLQAQVVSLCSFISKAYGEKAGSIALQGPLWTVSWQRSDVGTVTLNVDGSTLTNPSLIRFGGLVRDSSGSFLRGFYGSVGVSDILYAEVLALLWGL